MLRVPIMFRYLLREFVPLYLVGLFAILALLLIDYVASLAGSVIQCGTPVAVVLQSIVNRIPIFLVYMLAPALAWSVLIGLGRLARDSELKALYAAGVRPMALLGPVVVFGLVITVLSFLNANFLLPQASERWNQIWATLCGGSPSAGVQITKSFATKNGQLLFHAGTITPRPNDDTKADLLGVMVVDGDTVFTAERGEWDVKTKTWKLQNVFSRRLETGQNTPLVVSLPGEAEAQHLFPFDLDIKPVSKASEYLSWSELQTRLKQTGLSRDERYEADFQLNRRLADPLAALVMALVGGAFGLMLTNRAWGFTGMIVLVFGYWVLWTLSTKLLQNQGLMAWVAAWLPVLVFLPVVAYGLRRLR